MRIIEKKLLYPLQIINPFVCEKTKSFIYFTVTKVRAIHKKSKKICYTKHIKILPIYATKET